MIKNILTSLLFLLITSICFSQKDTTTLTFISDTQEPLGIEKLVQKNSKYNAVATSILLHHIAEQPSKNIFILGDIVGLGFKDKFWKTVDTFLVDAREKNKNVFACLGNHDVMIKTQKGIEQFEKRFPNQSTNYYEIVDSIAVVMLNSNFKKMGKEAFNNQIDWYNTTLQQLDTMPNVKTTIVCCHHSPYSNSKIVGSNKQVQNAFVTSFQKSKKCKIFMSGHSHNFEHFIMEGKSFFVIGGGGGIHQPLKKKPDFIDVSKDYKPLFHYVTLSRKDNQIHLISYQLKENKISLGYECDVNLD